MLRKQYYVAGGSVIWFAAARRCEVNNCAFMHYYACRVRKIGWLPEQLCMRVRQARSPIISMIGDHETLQFIYAIMHHAYPPPVV
jgi:hypothetical protein